MSLNTTSLLVWANTNLNVPLVNHGTATLANGGLTLGPGVSITNAAGATLKVEDSVVVNGSGSFVNQAGATFLMVPTPSNNYAIIDVPVSNAGTLEVDGGTLYLNGGLTNSGNVEILGGVLSVSGGYVQTAGNTVVSGGSLTGSVQVQGGSFQGNPTGDFTNFGPVTIVPSPAPATPAFSFTQSSTGSLNEQIGGLTPGSQYGQIVVAGAVNLDGACT